MANSFDRTPGVQAPMGNVNQIYVWKEPITSDAFTTSEYKTNLDDIYKNARIK